MPPRTSPEKEQTYLRNVSSKKVAVTETITIPAGAAGSVVDFDVTTRPIASLTGADLGGVGNTSFVLTSTAFITLVNFKEDTDLANGEYYLDHLTGKGRGKKADTSTSGTAAFSVFALKTMLEGGDIELGSVELKDGATDTRAVINAANTARVATDPVVLVQTVDAVGNVLGRDAANTARTTATLVNPVQVVDASGQVVGPGDLNTTLQNAVSATGNGTTLDVAGKATATILITGTFVATVTFEGSIDDSTWVSLFACKVGDGTIATTASTTGLYRIPCTGLKSVRARVTWTSGTSITAVGRVSGLSSASEDAIFARLIEKLAGEQIGRDVVSVEQVAGTTRITTATTTTCLSGVGVLLGVLIEAATAGTATIYDNTAGSGTIIAILPIGTPAGFYQLPRPITTGVTVVTSGADRVVVFAKA